MQQVSHQQGRLAQMSIGRYGASRQKDSSHRVRRERDRRVAHRQQGLEIQRRHPLSLPESGHHISGGAAAQSVQ